VCYWNIIRVIKPLIWGKYSAIAENSGRSYASSLKGFPSCLHPLMSTKLLSLDLKSFITKGCSASDFWFQNALTQQGIYVLKVNAKNRHEAPLAGKGLDGKWLACSALGLFPRHYASPAWAAVFSDVILPPSLTFWWHPRSFSLATASLLQMDPSMSSVHNTITYLRWKVSGTLF
jgi:hypothetical protein